MVILIIYQIVELFSYDRCDSLEFQFHRSKLSSMFLIEKVQYYNIFLIRTSINEEGCGNYDGAKIPE